VILMSGIMISDLDRVGERGMVYFNSLLFLDSLFIFYQSSVNALSYRILRKLGLAPQNIRHTPACPLASGFRGLSF
jgi:hypothetical protein